MLISLILCTINRTKELDNFLKALNEQLYRNFELILVDQNLDDRVVPIIKKYQKSFSIRHIRAKKGLSFSRNIGLGYVSGDIVAFPDDDCTYPPELLENINTFFSNNQYSILMGKTIDKSTGDIVAGKSVYKKENLSCYKFLGSSTTMFLYLKIIDKKDIIFDENLGLGVRFGSGEEEDLMIRLLQRGYKGFYNPEINFVYHPPSDLNFSDLKRAKKRAEGFGAMIVKHLFSFCGVFYFVKYVLLHPVVSIFKSLFKLDLVMLKYHLVRFLGIIEGMISYIMLKKNI